MPVARFTLHPVEVGCGGAASALPAPNDAVNTFLGAMAVHRGSCPDVTEGYHLDGAIRTFAGGTSNATLEFFCTDFPGVYHLLVDARAQPLHTEGPPSLAGQSAPLAAGNCPATWTAIDTALGTTAPQTWSEGGAPNVLRRGRVYYDLEVYLSYVFGAAPFVDGERREACLSYSQVARRRRRGRVAPGSTFVDELERLALRGA